MAKAERISKLPHIAVLVRTWLPLCPHSKAEDHPLRKDAPYQRFATSGLNLLDRDVFIADQINSTLQEGDSESIFRKDHKIDTLLSPDIQIINYLGNEC